jgi:hypothetical protein
VPGTKVHPDLRQQHQRYKILAAGLVISSILPAVTFFIFYSSNAGLAYLSRHLLSVMVAFIVQIPLVLGLAYLIGVKRMRFLERSSSLVNGGAKQELTLTGAYKFTSRDGTKGCRLDIAMPDGVESFTVIPSPSIENYVNTLPDLPEPAAEGAPSITSRSENINAFIDPLTKKPVAVEVNGNVLWLSPPANLL